MMCMTGAGCVDVTIDPANCGSCGHACTAPSGNTPKCSASRCLPFAVSDVYDPGTPITAIAADPATPGVYWATGATSSQLHGIDMTGAHDSMVDLGASVGGLAAHNSHVFYTANTGQTPGLYEWQLQTNALTSRQTVAKLTSVGAVVSGDGENVVWGAGLAAANGGPWNIYGAHLGNQRHSTNAATPSSDTIAAMAMTQPTRRGTADMRASSRRAD